MKTLTPVGLAVVLFLVGCSAATPAPQRIAPIVIPPTDTPALQPAEPTPCVEKDYNERRDDGSVWHMCDGTYRDTQVDAPAPAANPTPTPTSKPIPPPMSDYVQFLIDYGARPGGRASVTVQTKPGVLCSIDYYTPLGTHSQAQGLVPKYADGIGQVSWSWIIGTNTRPGTGTVTVTCGTASASAQIVIPP